MVEAFDDASHRASGLIVDLNWPRIHAGGIVNVELLVPVRPVQVGTALKRRSNRCWAAESSITREIENRPRFHLCECVIGRALDVAEKRA